MQKIPFNQLKDNAAQLIGAQWMLITAGKAGSPTSFNTMTASWGGLGFLWNRPVAYVFVRPNRHTAQFINEEKGFTLSFMPSQYREALTFCGRNSGRDLNKISATALQEKALESGLVAMHDAELILECRKMYVQEMSEESFLDWNEVSPRYYEEGNPLHVMYIAEITETWVRAIDESQASSAQENPSQY